MEKVYRLPTVRQTQHAEADLHERQLGDVSDLCIGKSISKPTPPRPFQLKRDNQPKKAPCVTHQSKRQRINSNSYPNGTKRSSALASAVYSNEDVLASLKKMSLIEPFLNERRTRPRPVNKPTLTLSRPVQFSVQWNGDNKDNSGTAIDGHCTPNSDSGIDRDFAPMPQLSFDSQGKLPGLDSIASDAFTKSSDHHKQLEFLQKESFDPAVSHFSHRSTELHPAAVKSAANLASATDLREVCLEEQETHILPRRLSQGFAPPTATLVDITTGGIVDHGSGYDVGQADSFLRSGNGVTVPPSFYFNKRKKRKGRDRELDALKRVRRYAGQEESASDTEARPRSVEQERRSGLGSVSLSTHAMQPRLVSFPELPKNQASAESESPVYRPPSPSHSALSTTSSSSSCERHQLRAPNPTPHLEDNRFQIFPTTQPNTFHVYCGSRGQPTVISVEDVDPDFWLRSRELRRQVNNVRNKRIAAGGFRRAPPTSYNTQRRQASPGAMDAFVQGCSLAARSGRVAKEESDDDVSLADQSASCEETRKGFLHLPQVPTSSTNSENESSDCVKPQTALQSVSLFAPLKGLGFKRHRANEHIVATSREASGALSEILLQEPQKALPGHLSPLKGVPLLRRKITVRQHESMKSFAKDNEKRTGKDSRDSVVLLVNRLNESSKSAEKLLKKISFGSDTDLSLHMILPRRDNASFLRARGTTRLKTAALQSTRGDGMPVNCSINVEKLCLEGDPYFMLKEGNSQSLNFIEPYVGSVTPELHLKPGQAGRKRRTKRLGSVKLIDDKIHVKVAAGGGFRSNVTHYSLLLRQKQFRQRLKDQEDSSAEEQHSRSSRSRERYNFAHSFSSDLVFEPGSVKNESAELPHEKMFSPSRIGVLTPADLATYTPVADPASAGDPLNV